MRYCIDHRLARFKGLGEILCLEGSTIRDHGRDHGQGFHAWNDCMSTSSKITSFVLVGIIIARRDRRSFVSRISMGDNWGIMEYQVVSQR
jgi:hypothetical protein